MRWRRDTKPLPDHDWRDIGLGLLVAGATLAVIWLVRR